MKYLFVLGVFFLYSHADVDCTYFKTATQAQKYYDKKLIGYKGLIADEKGKVCAYLDKKLYVIRRRKGGYSDYTQRLLTKDECERQIRARKRAITTSFIYSCFDKVTQPKTKPKNKASGIRR